MLILGQQDKTQEQEPKFLTWESVSLLAYVIFPIAGGAFMLLAGWVFILAAAVIVGVGVAWFQFVRSNGAEAHYFFGLINALTTIYMGSIALVTVAYSLFGVAFGLHFTGGILLVGVGAAMIAVLWLWTRTFVPKFQAYPGFTDDYQTTDQQLARSDEELLTVLVL